MTCLTAQKVAKGRKARKVARIEPEARGVTTYLCQMVCQEAMLKLKMDVASALPSIWEVAKERNLDRPAVKGSTCAVDARLQNIASLTARAGLD
jgi:hypothetical protein